MALVKLDVTDEELDAALRQLEEDDRWRKENPEKNRLLITIEEAVIQLEKLRAELRNS
jgi:L-fucose isomerase-like protein